jgi:glycosyltransferase involved in cell wall biosynthesis
MEGMTRSIGVVIRTRNSARYLPRALESVVTQDLAPDDVVVVDGGSTDGTLDIVASFAPLVRTIPQVRPGLGGAAEDGVQALQTDLVAFQDSDDLWTDGRLRLLVEELLAHPSWGAVMGRVEHFISPDLPEDVQRTLSAPEGPQVGVGLPSLLAHRSVFAVAGPFMEEVMAGEYLEWMDRATRAGVVIGHVDIVCLQRRVHAGNTTRSDRTGRDYLKALHATIMRRKADDEPPPD